MNDVEASDVESVFENTDLLSNILHRYDDSAMWSKVVDILDGDNLSQFANMASFNNFDKLLTYLIGKCAHSENQVLM